MTLLTTLTPLGEPFMVAVPATYVRAPGPAAFRSSVTTTGFTGFADAFGSTLAAGTTVTNTGVVTWNNPPQTASGSVSIQVVTPPALTLTKGGRRRRTSGNRGS